jgi:hypothetical protein
MRLRIRTLFLTVALLSSLPTTASAGCRWTHFTGCLAAAVTQPVATDSLRAIHQDTADTSRPIRE